MQLTADKIKVRIPRAQGDDAQKLHTWESRFYVAGYGHREEWELSWSRSRAKYCFAAIIYLDSLLWNQLSKAAKVIINVSNYSRLQPHLVSRKTEAKLIYPCLELNIFLLLTRFSPLNLLNSISFSQPANQGKVREPNKHGYQNS